jgi:hypothetical protein
LSEGVYKERKEMIEGDADGRTSNEKVYDTHGIGMFAHLRFPYVFTKSNGKSQ